MLMAHRTGDAPFVARTGSVVVLADAIFTATAMVAQPLTGFLLARASGWPLGEPWILASIALYLMVGAFWLPVIRIQAQLRDLASEAAAAGAPLGDRYHRLFRVWFLFGLPGAGGMFAILWLMIAKPVLW